MYVQCTVYTIDFKPLQYEELRNVFTSELELLYCKSQDQTLISILCRSTNKGIESLEQNQIFKPQYL